METDTQEPTFLPEFVRVTSDSGGYAQLDLKETTAASQIYNNIAADKELLYLSNLNAEPPNDNDYIKVRNEDVLTFWLNIQGEYKTVRTIMVDRGEFGAEWQDHYSEYCGSGWPDITANYFSKSFYEDMERWPDWWGNFKNGDLSCEKSHWGSDNSSYVDAVDISAWAGHGTYDAQQGICMAFFTEQGIDLLPRSQVSWGDTDADWVVIHTCYFLSGTESELEDDLVGNGRNFHLICSFAGTCSFPWKGGEYFSECLEYGMSVKNAWFDYCEQYQYANAYPRVFGAEECLLDSLGYDGPAPISRDPTESSNWVLRSY